MPPNGALHGVKVLDFTQLLQGPYATQMFGDMGADVIKIEKAGSGDLYRSMTFFNEWIGDGESPCFLPWNRNKRSLAVDLKSPEGMEIVNRLADRADIIVENFRPGVMDKLGLGYEVIRARNPRVIYCSASGWGADGPYARRPGQDLLVQGLSGAVFASGKKSDGPVAIGTALSDQLGALHIVYSVLAALYAREKNGRGQRVEVNLLQSVLAFQMQDLFTVQNLGRTFERPESGIAHPGNGAPFGIYATSDGHITIAMNPWDKIISALGDESLHRYDDPQVRFDQRDVIYNELAAQIRRKTTAEWLDIMLGLDIWCAPVHRLQDVENDPQVRHLNSFVEVDHPKAGRVKLTNIPVRLSETPGAIRRPPPLVGQHGPEVLAELGFPSVEIDRLIERGVITVEKTPA